VTKIYVTNLIVVSLIGSAFVGMAYQLGRFNQAVTSRMVNGLVYHSVIYPFPNAIQKAKHKNKLHKVMVAHVQAGE
jgi:hypothetical protein